MKADMVLNGVEGFFDWEMGLVNRMEAGSVKFCGWCAGLNPFGREGWSWAFVQLVALAGIAVLCVPCLAVCVVGLVLGVALLVVAVAGLAGYALLMGLVVVLAGLWGWGVRPLCGLVKGLGVPAEPSGAVLAESSEPAGVSGCVECGEVDGR